MKKIKVSEANENSLDWLVAKCQGEPVRIHRGRMRYSLSQMMSSCDDLYSPSTDWSTGGPIVERERIGVHTLHDFWEARGECRNKSIRTVRFMEKWGPTPLIAAMRCYVASKLGDEVEVPEELT